jgi:hypothetical protein
MLVWLDLRCTGDNHSSYRCGGQVGSKGVCQGCTQWGWDCPQPPNAVDRDLLQHVTWRAFCRCVHMLYCHLLFCGE